MSLLVVAVLLWPATSIDSVASSQPTSSTALPAPILATGEITEFVRGEKH
eukprot:SAG31_NODE_19489_length_600_cov_1.029940_2_plen_49_part_01